MRETYRGFSWISQRPEEREATHLEEGDDRGLGDEPPHVGVVVELRHAGSHGFRRRASAIELRELLRASDGLASISVRPPK